MLTEQDRVNIDFAEQWIEKAKKKGGKDWEAVKGPIKWVGEVGFNECVRHLSKKKGIESANAMCGALKHKARETGQLATKHMGRIEKQKARKKGKK